MLQAAKGKGGAKQQQLQKQKPPDMALGKPAQQHRDPEIKEKEGDTAEEKGAATQEAAAEQRVWIANAPRLSAVPQTLHDHCTYSKQGQWMASKQPANIQRHKHCSLLQDLVDSDTASTELKERIAAAQKRKQQQQQEKTGFAQVLLRLFWV